MPLAGASKASEQVLELQSVLLDVACGREDGAALQLFASIRKLFIDQRGPAAIVPERLSVIARNVMFEELVEPISVLYAEFESQR